MNRIKNHHLKTKAIEVGYIVVNKKKYDYWIVPAPFYGALNGYAIFDKCPTIERGYGGVLTYVPVHGGITFCDQCVDGTIYGFDTSHCDSEEYPRSDVSWIKEQIVVMINGILVAKKVERKYLSAKTNNQKAKLLQKIQEVGAVEQRTNFGVNINLLMGQL